jgi:hypothetical protein
VRFLVRFFGGCGIDFSLLWLGVACGGLHMCAQ